MIEQLMNEYGYRESGTDDLLMPHVLTDSNSVGYGVGVESLTEGSWPFDQPSAPNGSTPMATLDVESYYPEPEPPLSSRYMYFEAAEANSTVSFKTPSDSSVPNFEYSIDDCETWNEWTYTTHEEPYGSGSTIMSVFDNITLSNIGDKVYLKGVNHYISGGFILNGSLYCHGNAQTLVDGDNPTLVAKTMPHFYGDGGEASALLSAPELPATTLAEECYNWMFASCSSLTEAPDLPATSLANNCYSRMFYNCTSLTQAPELPATTLADGCYSGMFEDCTSLTQAPELPATTLAEGCYKSMFSNCTSLTEAPELPSTNVVFACYDHMFAGCTSLIVAPELPDETLDFDMPISGYGMTSCYSYMFQGCTSLTQAPELPATTLTAMCYAYMFQNCTSLTQAPELPATTLAGMCYAYMFKGCTSLTQAPELPATTLAGMCYAYMFQDCASLTLAHELPATTLSAGCYQGMFYGCTSLVTAPKLPATTLFGEYPYGCYQDMFRNCTSLNSVICLAETIPNNSTYNWLYGVSQSGMFTKSPNMSSWTTGDSGIPSGWTVQDYSE